MTTLVKVEYAHFVNDLVNNELGKYPWMPLEKAMKIVKRMLESGYVQVRITTKGI